MKAHLVVRAGLGYKSAESPEGSASVPISRLGCEQVAEYRPADAHDLVRETGAHGPLLELRPQPLQ